MKLKCPKCGNQGETGIGDTAFEVRGNVGGKPVVRCNQCGSGVTKGVLFGKARLIPESDLARMKSIWRDQFGEEW